MGAKIFEISIKKKSEFLEAALDHRVVSFFFKEDSNIFVSFSY